jgi:2-polyprenyl-3-methyl-5-hydroxy-6-metoxy-1,4-benzoquinol methylase
MKQLKQKSKEEYNASIVFYNKIINAFNADFNLYNSVLDSIKPTSLLEIGCGMGRLFPLYQKIECVYGIDLSEKMIHLAQSRFPQINLFVKDIMSFHFNKKFDVIVVSNSLLKHIETPNDRHRVIKNLKNHISKNGIILFDHSDYLYYEKETTDWIPAEHSVISTWIPNKDDILKGFQWKKSMSEKIDKVYWRYIENEKVFFDVEYTAYIYSISQLKHHLEINELHYEQILTDYDSKGLDDSGDRFIAIAGNNKELLSDYKNKIRKKFSELWQ